MSGLGLLTIPLGGVANTATAQAAARAAEPRAAAVNTGFIQTLYGPDGDGGEEAIDRAESQGLRVLLGDDGKLTVESRDFRRDRMIRTLEI